jgi:hypothetical protein
MPCSAATRPGQTLAPLCAICLLAAALFCAAPPVHGADTPAKPDKDTTVTIKAFPPSIQVDAGSQAGKDEAGNTDASSADSRETTKKRSRARVQIDDEDFDVSDQPWNFAHKNPWIIGLIFLVVGSIFLTPVILLVGIIWYKLRKTRLQNEAMLKLAEHGVVPPAQAADALASSAAPSAVAPQLYHQAVALRKRVAWSDLRKGIILSTVGAAFCLYWIIAGGEASWVGLILLFLGVGYIVLWWLEGRNLNQAAAGRAGNGAQAESGRENNGVPGSSGP